MDYKFFSAVCRREAKIARVLLVDLINNRDKYTPTQIQVMETRIRDCQISSHMHYLCMTE